MDKMFWFGWLLKGKMNVSILDRLMFWVELAALLALVLGIFVVVSLFEAPREDR